MNRLSRVRNHVPYDFWNENWWCISNDIFTLCCLWDHWCSLKPLFQERKTFHTSGVVISTTVPHRCHRPSGHHESPPPSSTGSFTPKWVVSNTTRHHGPDTTTSHFHVPCRFQGVPSPSWVDFTVVSSTYFTVGINPLLFKWTVSLPLLHPLSCTRSYPLCTTWNRNLDKLK